MMDHKKMELKQARAGILLRISNVGEDKKQKLYEKYKSETHVITSEDVQKVLIGNWCNNAAKMLIKGATEEELDTVVEHLIVLIGMRKYNLDFKKSFKDRNLLNLARKYLDKEKVEIKLVPSTSEQRKTQMKKREALREAAKQETRALREEGLNNAEIAERLNLPESTIRVLAE